MKNFVREFKEFVLRGNVIDMAVGVVIGAAFKAVIDSVVKDILNPIVGFLLAGIRFNDLVITLRKAHGDLPAVTINYGNLIQAAISFLLTAFVLFLIVRAYNKARNLKLKKEADEAQALADEKPAEPSEKEILQSILDELRKKGAN